jgi:hypothetical protein
MTELFLRQKVTPCTPENTVLLKVAEVKVQNGTISWYVSFQFELEHSNIV